MPLLTFSPTQAPNPGGGWTQKPRVLIAAFGDGYEQRTPNGVNTMPRSGTWDWNPTSVAVADYIINFMAATRGSDAFWWTPPRASSPIKFRATSWDRRHLQWTIDAVSISLVEVFDTGT